MRGWAAAAASGKCGQSRTKGWCEHTDPLRAAAGAGAGTANLYRLRGCQASRAAWFYVHQPILPRKWSCRISFPSRACRVRRRWRGAGMLLDGGGSCPRCRGRGEVLGSEDGGFAAGAGAQRPRGSASRGSGCSWGQTPCSAAARPAPRRAGGAGLCSALGLPGLPFHGGASPEQGLGAAPPAPGAAQGCVNAAGPGAPSPSPVVRAEPLSRQGRCPPAGLGPGPSGEGRSRCRFMGAGWRGLGPGRCLPTCEGVGPALSLQFNSPRALLSSFWGCESDKSL